MANNKNTGQQMRVTDEELSLLKNTFADNEVLLKLMRKMFLPELSADAPIGQTIDLWMTIDVKDQSPEEAKVRIMARNELIQHVESQLMQIKILAGSKDETPEETKKRLLQNSAK